MKPETLVQHPPEIHLPEGNTPLVAPIYQSVKFTVEHLEDLPALLSPEGGGYFYSRARNPTVRQLELLLARMQGQQDGLCVGSGVAALSVPLLSLLRAGDHVVMFLESYKPTRYLVRSLLGRFGVRATLLSVADTAGLQAVLASTPTRLCLFESPTNPSLRVADIERITALCREHGALTLLDNTFAGLHNHGQYPVDLFVHSLTKYAAGHGDVMGGAILGSRELLGLMQEDAINLGAVLDPHAAYLILRGLKTYPLRFERQCRTAEAVAAWLCDQQVLHVRYPGLPSHPQHALALRQMRDFGGMIAFDLPGGDAAVPRFIDALRLFRLAGSLGSTESLVVPAHRFFAGDLSAQEAAQADLRPGAIRLSIGLEDAGDLIADLSRALAALPK